MAARIRKGDKVVVITGADKGKRGEVLSVRPKDDRAVVQGVNMAKKHVKPQGMGKPGGIIEQEATIHLSNLMPDRSEDRQADARWVPGAGRRPQGPDCPCDRRRDRGLRT